MGRGKYHLNIVSQPVASSTPKKRLLVLHPGQGLALMLRQELERLFEVLTVVGTLDVCRALASSRFDMLMIDGSHEDIEGPSLRNVLRALSPRVPILMIAGACDMDTIVKRVRFLAER